MTCRDDYGTACSDRLALAGQEIDSLKARLAAAEAQGARLLDDAIRLTERARAFESERDYNYAAWRREERARVETTGRAEAAEAERDRMQALLRDLLDIAESHPHIGPAMFQVIARARAALRSEGTDCRGEDHRDTAPHDCGTEE